MTKPDSANSQGLQDKFLKLVQNEDEKNHMKLGWHVLRNPGPMENWETRKQREAEEDAFFATPPWNQLPKEMTRARFLAEKLSTQLTCHIATYVPGLRESVQRQLDNVEAELKILGEGTDDDAELRVNLTRLLNLSAKVTGFAAHGHYINDDEVLFFTGDESKDDPPAENLRALVVRANELFACNLMANGHSRKLASDSCDFVVVSEDMHLKKKEYAAREVVKKIANSIGPHLPDNTPYHVPYSLFFDHSRGWQKLASSHIDRVNSICESFLAKVLEKLWPRPMHGPLRQHFLDREKDACSLEAKEELQKLVHDLQLQVQPYDPAYEKRLKEWRANHEGAPQNTQGRFQTVGYTPAELVLEQSLVIYEVSSKVSIYQM